LSETILLDINHLQKSVDGILQIEGTLKTALTALAQGASATGFFCAPDL
jgi:hypothetical protein